MSRFYVKVVDGKVVDGPHPMSSSESDSPNVNWGPEQLKLNNIFIVNLDHDPLTQVVDYTSPKITKDAVTYPILSLPDDQKIINTNKSLDENRRREYPSTDELIIALWEKVVEERPEYADKLQKLRVDVKLKYPKQ